MEEQEMSVEQFEQYRLAADDAARAAYQESQARNEGERIALAKAELAWKKTMDEAGLTGMYQGQYTMPVQQWQAETFGTWGAPQQGQQTAAYQQQQFGQGAEMARQFGQWYAPGTTPTGRTLTAEEQAYTQALRTQQEARAAQAQQQSQAQQYLNLLASLRGPADWAKYQQVLGSTPGGMRDLVAAAMGQYVPGGGATTGVQPQAVSLQSLMGQVSGQPYAGQGGGQLQTPNVYQGGQGSYGTAAQNLAALQGQPQQAGAAPQRYGPVSGTGQVANPDQFQQYQQQNNQAVNAMGGGTNTMGAQQPGQPQANQMNLPAPNQIAPQSWNAMAPSQKEMLKGVYEAQGWHIPDVEALFAQSLPKYAANAPTAGTFRF